MLPLSSRSNDRLFALVTVGHGFTNDSGLQMNLSSFLGTMPIPLRTIQSVELGKDPIRFVQIVGARTNAAEIIIKNLGGSRIEIQIVHSTFGLPPIWSELELTLSSHDLHPTGFRSNENETGSRQCDAWRSLQNQGSLITTRAA